MHEKGFYYWMEFKRSSSTGLCRSHGIVLQFLCWDRLLSQNSFSLKPYSLMALPTTVIDVIKTINITGAPSRVGAGGPLRLKLSQDIRSLLEGLTEGAVLANIDLTELLQLL